MVGEHLVLLPGQKELLTDKRRQDCAVESVEVKAKWLKFFASSCRSKIYSVREGDALYGYELLHQEM